MKYYRAIRSRDYECVVLDDMADYETIFALSGKSIKDTWRPIRISTDIAQKEERGMNSDFPWMTSNVLIMRERSLIVLGKILEVYGEILPLESTSGARMWMFNCLRMLDALDVRACLGNVV